MGLSGKLIGAGLGLFLGGPLGAVIGGLIGHYVKDAPLGDGEEPAREDPSLRQHQQELYFTANLVGILTAMSRVDGEIQREEVQAIRSFFYDRLGYRGESLEIVRDLVKQFLKTGVDVDALCRDLSRRADYPTRLLLIECLRDVARADGTLNSAEQAFLDRIGFLLGIAPEDAAGLRARSAGAGKEYEVLGVAPSAGQQEVKRAYREMVKKYHPDRVAHLGEEFRKLAHDKFLEVQAAYDRIRKSAGWTE